MTTRFNGTSEAPSMSPFRKEKPFGKNRAFRVDGDEELHWTGEISFPTSCVIA